MSNEYLYNIISQYQAITGKQKFDLDSKEDFMELNDWILKYKNQISVYSSFLEYLHVVEKSKYNVEFHKGFLDTATIPSDETLIVSPYIEHDFKKGNRQVINGTLDISRKQPDIILKSNCGVINLYDFEYFLTHNPYQKCDYNKFMTLASKGYNICFGVFGDIHDKNYSDKINLISNMSSLDNIDIKTARVKDIYLAAAYTNQQKQFFTKFKEKENKTL